MHCLLQVWQDLLQEESEKSRGGSLSNSTLLLLGDRQCGKSSLLSKLQGKELSNSHAKFRPTKPLALDYAFMDLKNKDSLNKGVHMCFRWD